MAIALSSSAHPPSYPSFSASRPHLSHRPLLFTATTKKPKTLLSPAAAENGSGVDQERVVAVEKDLNYNGTAAPPELVLSKKFHDPRWIGGTWDLGQFQTDRKTDWDAVIDAEVNRRKWLEDNPEPSSNESPVLFDTSFIPWWVWMKKFHLPEAELLNAESVNTVTSARTS